MSDLIKINIDGKDLEVEQGITVLAAARKANIDIPTLCFLKDVNNAGDCRMCIVEIEGRRGYVPSCNTVVTDGMVVRTNTDKVNEARRTVLDLILSTIENNISYSASANIPVYSVTYQSYVLTTNDYSIGYLRNNVSTNDLINAGTIVIRLTGKNNFKGIIDLTYDIVPKLLSSNDIDVEITSSNLIYTGSEICPNIRVSMGSNILKIDKDYTLSYSNNVNATNSALITISAVTNSNYQGVKQITFAIERKSLEISFVEDINEQVYTSEEIRPNLVIKDDNKTLIFLILISFSLLICILVTIVEL